MTIKSRYQIMRSILFYDLPMDSEYQIKVYNRFRNNLIKLGYSMIQNSVYIKVLNSKTISIQHLEKLKKITPKQGNIRVLILTEKQYQDMFILSGIKTNNELINDTKRFRIL